MLSATLVRRALNPDTEVSEVSEPGLVGRLFLPPADRGIPAVALFPGSEGGLDSQSANAAVLASHGCAALVVATFVAGEAGTDGLPTQLARIPLETFTTAVQWLRGLDGVDPLRVSAMSISRGSEGLLSAAAHTDLALHMLVAVSPSCVTWVGLGERGSLTGVPAWTWQGVGLPAVPTDDDAIFADMAREALRRRGRPSTSNQPLRMLRAYAPKLGDSAQMQASAIPVENIDCPLLLVAGADDQMWPSVEMARLLMTRRSNPADQLLIYPGAGHYLRLGLWPTTADRTGNVALGGEAAAHAAAEADMTPRIIAAVTGAATTSGAFTGGAVTGDGLLSS